MLTPRRIRLKPRSLASSSAAAVTQKRRHSAGTALGRERLVVALARSMRGTRARVARHRPTPRGNSHRPGIDVRNPARNSPARPQRAPAAGSPTYRRGAAARVPGPHQGHLRRREPGLPISRQRPEIKLGRAGPPETETSTGKTIGAGAADSRRTHVASGHGGMNF